MPSHTAAGTVHHVDALAPGARLGEFEVLSLLGVGGFGMVYRAYDHSLQRFVAIKEYMPTALAGRMEGQSLRVRSSGDEASYQAGLASFVNEARLLAQFDHPSLVKVFRFWEAHHTAYMVMPLYSGMTLKQARASMRTPPPEAWLRQVLWSVLGALRVLHGAQMLHRDISPDNIFLQHVGPPVLLDLGAARHAIGGGGDGIHQHTAVLKVNYAPIEQYAEAGSDLRQGAWSDLYSLAAVVHGCLCNDTPMPATLRAIRDRMVPFERVAHTVEQQWGLAYSEPFVRGISQALQLQPHDRPQSADELVRLLELQQPASGLEHFDFRAELGDVWVEPGAVSPGAAVERPDVPVTATVRMPDRERDTTHPALAPAHEPPTSSAVSTPEAAYGPFAAGGAHDELAGSGDGAAVHSMPGATVSASAPVGAEPPGTASVRRWAPVAMLAGVLVAGFLAAGWPWRGETPQARTPDSDIVTEWAKPAPSIPAATPEPAAAPLSPEQDASASPAQAQPDATPPADIASHARRQERRVGSSVKRAHAAAGSAGTSGLPADGAAGGAPSSQATDEPPPSPARQAPRPRGPVEACADSSMLTRPMCIHRECQSSAFTRHPVCVELRQRAAEEARRRETFSP